MKTKKDLKIFGTVASVLLVIATFADMEISQMLYNPNSFSGKILEAFGEFPAMYIAAFCAMAIGVVQKNRNGGNLNLKGGAALFFAIFFSLTSGNLPGKYITDAQTFGTFLGFAIFIVNYRLATMIARSHEEELYKAAVFGLQLFVTVVVAFNLIKMGWGRECYRHMVETGDFSGFTAWYLPNGLTMDNEFMSFPSGHSANAAITMWLTLLPTFVMPLKEKEKQLKLLSCLWIACVMLSGIVMGAHFLGDVAMGVTLSLGLFYVLYRRKYVETK